MFKTPKKMRAVKVREQLDDGFLRRGKRMSEKLGGFKNEESAKKFKEAKGKKVPSGPKKTPKPRKTPKAKKPIEPNVDPVEAVPLAIIPPNSSEVAPHLPKDVLAGIGEGFLQIQPSAVSAALLEVDDIDE